MCSIVPMWFKKKVKHIVTIENIGSHIEKDHCAQLCFCGLKKGSIFPIFK